MGESMRRFDLGRYRLLFFELLGFGGASSGEMYEYDLEFWFKINFYSKVMVQILNCSTVVN